MIKTKHKPNQKSSYDKVSYDKLLGLGDSLYEKRNY